MKLYILIQEELYRTMAQTFETHILDKLRAVRNDNGSENTPCGHSSIDKHTG